MNPIPALFSATRGYNPPPSTLNDLRHLHTTLGIDRVVFTQPSVYGIDNAAILNAMVPRVGKQKAAPRGPRYRCIVDR